MDTKLNRWKSGLWMICLIACHITSSLNAEPFILSEPRAPVVVTEGDILDLKVDVEGVGVLQYQWFKNGGPIAGENSDHLLFSPLELSDFGRYHVTVSDITGSVSSVFVFLRVSPASNLKFSRQPEDTTIEEGVRTFLEVEVESDGEPRYQWFHNNEPVDNSNSSRLNIDAAQLADRGQYYVVVTQASSSITSQTISLNVLPGVIRILDQISNQAVVAGGSISLWAEVITEEPLDLTYTWFKDSEPIAITPKPNLEIPSFSAEHEGSYQLQVSADGVRIISEPILIELNRNGIIISRNPGNFEALVGSDVTFSVEAESPQTLSYQWFKDGKELSQANQSQLVLESISFDDAGRYHVRISNASRFVDSRVGRLDVIEGALRIVEQPSPGLIPVGGQILFEAKVIGSTQIQYQWLKDGLPIADANTPFLFLTDADLDDSGKYKLEAINSVSQVVSDEVELRVEAIDINILVQPGDQAVIEGDTLTLSVVATSSATIKYQWFHNNQPIQNETSPVLILSKAQKTLAGEYYVKLQSGDQSIQSESAQVKVSSDRSTPVSMDIRRIEGKIELSWPVSSGDSSIEFSQSVGAEAQWLPSPVSASENGDLFVVQLPIPSSVTFYRVVLR